MSLYTFKQKFLTTFSAMTIQINRYIVPFILFLSVTLYFLWELTKYIISSIFSSEGEIYFLFQIQELSNAVVISLLIVFFAIIYQKRESAYIESLSIMHNGIIKATLKEDKFVVNYVNEKVVNLVGLETPNDMIGINIKTIFPDDLSSQLAQFFANPEIEIVKNIETELVGLTDNIITPVLLTSFKSYSINNRVKNIFIVVTDIKEQKKAHQQSQHIADIEKNSLINNLVQKVGHEINNPLSYMFYDTERLTEYVNEMSMLIKIYDQINEKITAALPQSKVNSQDPVNLDISSEMSELNKLKEKININMTMTELEEILDSTKEGLTRIANVVKEVRAYPLHHTGRFKQDFNRVVSLTVNLVRSQYESEIGEHISIKTKLADNLPQISIKAGEIGQVILNIILNSIYAIKSSLKEKGCINIETTLYVGDEKEKVCLKIEDNGTGIDTKNLNEIFYSYYTTKKEGTGLGLTLVKRIVDDHEGQIRVESDPGSGTSFFIFFPVDPD